jgi:hypothetical protein
MTDNSSDGAKADVRAEALATPHEHAVALGAFRTRKLQAGAVVAAIGGGTPNLDEYSWQHAAAAGLHGWTEHEHHAAEPMRLAAAAYKAALVAASTPVSRAAVDFERAADPKRKLPELLIAKGDNIKEHKLTSQLAAEIGLPVTTDYEPHAPALSPHAAHVQNSKRAEAEAQNAEAEEA